MTKPPRLLPGDTIALVTPASPPLAPEIIDRAAELFTQRGFQVEIGASARKRNGFIAGTDKERLSDLQRALTSRRVKAVVCIRGGYGTGRIVHRLPFDRIAKAPKILVGCSDITVLHNAMAVEAGVVSFHGPMPQSLVETDCPEFTWNHLLDTLSGKENHRGSLVATYPERDNTVVCVRKGRATGRLVGGNLTVFTSLIGTPYLPTLKGSIFFFEDIGEKPFRMDRVLTQLLSAGLLQEAAGFALGLFKDCEYPPSSEYRQSIAEVIHERLAPLGKPVVMGLPFGHVPFNATIPVGIKATLDGTRGDLVFEELAVA